MERTLYETLCHRGYDINIYYDTDAESPREWSNLGTFYTAHRRYRPEKEFDKHFEFDEVCNEQPGNLRGSFLKKYVAQNLYFYDHSGQTISSRPFSCPWDSGWFGIVAVSVEKVKKEFGWKLLTAARRRKIEEYLQGEIDTYDNYLRGEVYGYQITPADDKDNVLESCWGYFGDTGLDQLKDECRDTIDHLISEKERQEHEEHLRIFGPELPFPEFALAIQ